MMRGRGEGEREVERRRINEGITEEWVTGMKNKGQNGRSEGIEGK